MVLGHAVHTRGIVGTHAPFSSLGSIGARTASDFVMAAIAQMLEVNRVIDQFDISLPEDLFTRWQGA